MTARDALGAALDALTAAGCETPRLDAELLIADALGVSRADLAMDPELPVSGRAARLIGERVRRRVAREPVAYILGVKGFRRLMLQVDGRVLIPRPETELLVEVALELPAGSRVHDVGTGSGAVALALIDERPDLVVSASDASSSAVEVARANGLDAVVHRGLPAGEYDMVVANLPYVREDEWDGVGARDPAVGAAGGAGGRGRRVGRDSLARCPSPGWYAAGAGARTRANGGDKGAVALAARSFRPGRAAARDGRRPRA